MSIKPSEALTASMERGLIIVRGLPGSGKSTFAAAMANTILFGAHIEADMFFEGERGYSFDASKLPIAHEWCLKRTETLLNECRVVFVSNTFSRRWEYEPYVKLAEALNVPCHVLTMTGNYGNVHGVPVEAIERMRQRWEP